MKTLLSKMASVKLPDRRGNTPLHLAVHQGYRNVVTTLLENGADIFALNASSLTSLDIAKERMHVDIANDIMAHVERANYKHSSGTPWT